ncbi:hypothetical protein Athai_05280 [Actinocatenispora thailandica]|uniref:Uncharacterized protein n=1 Tax=Actinocatenispora thailandica TaxID=227318 RepID=A0A7R7DJT0_9ACTN|nr:hypothetical protein [Actinocatenispora thailandica]BCJ33025.1 hypothetical protein Athai_05280 [Actinocatenispora thailandica]
MPLSIRTRCVPVRPAAPLPRRGMAGWAIGTVAFFAAVGGLPKSWTSAAGDLIPVLLAVFVAAVVPAAAGRNLQRWLTAPYVLGCLAAVTLDVAAFPHGSVPALLVGVLPASGGLLSWSRPRTGRSGPEGETR